MPAVFVGIDVSKARLDVCIRPSRELFSSAHCAVAVGALITRLPALAPALVVLEATGGYEALAARLLTEAGLPVAVVNPRQVRLFARAKGLWAKTDELDAGVLAHFAEAMQPPIRALRDTATEEMSQLVTRRRQLVEMLVAERNRTRLLTGPALADVEASIQFLEGRLAKLEQRLAEHLAHQADWQQKAAIVRSVPGIGPVVTNTLLAELPELGQLSAKQIAALLGVAPYNRDSGPRRGVRRVGGGRGPLRAVLYMAVVASLRCNKAIKSY